MQKNSLEYYNSLDEFPLFNWKHCVKGDVSFSRVNLENGNEKKDIEAFNNLYNEYLQTFGVPKDALHYYVLVGKLTRLYKEYAISGDEFIFNEIELTLEEIELLDKKDDKSTTIDDIIVYVSKWLGGGFINEKTTTVKQFYTAYHKMIEDYGKKD